MGRGREFSIFLVEFWTGIAFFGSMSEIKGRTMLVTGGAGGLGRSLAAGALRRGAKVVIWDIDASKADAAAAALSELGDVSARAVDVADQKRVGEACEALREAGVSVDILVNNAGIVVEKDFHEHSRDEMLAVMNVNACAPMIVASFFIGDMLARDCGHICNISSAAGLVSYPTMSVYAASKWAVFGWSDSLRQEMRRRRRRVRVTTVAPYYINTGLFKKAPGIIPFMEPDDAAERILCAIEKNVPVLGLPWTLNRIRFLQACLPPRIFGGILDRMLGVSS